MKEAGDDRLMIGRNWRILMGSLKLILIYNAEEWMSYLHATKVAVNFSEHVKPGFICPFKSVLIVYVHVAKI